VPLDANCWQFVSSPNLPSGSSQLWGVAAVSAADVWAVGRTVDTPNPGTLIEHWNGTAWSIVPSPNPGASFNRLNGVDALAANNVWAVGSADNQPLILHWNGTAWSSVEAPTSPGGAEIYSVAAISPNDIWAVAPQLSPDEARPLLHWNGTAWSWVAAPSGLSLLAIDGAASNDVWAVGYDSILHWDGTAWSTVQLPPNPPACSTFGSISLNDVTARASNDVWAVGSCPDPNAAQAAIAAHWDGVQWTAATVGPVASRSPNLYSVAVIAPDNAWAVGRVDLNPGKTLILHWDGNGWTELYSVSPGSLRNFLLGVSALTPDDIWAVGFDGPSSGPEQTLTEHYTFCPPPCPTERFTDVCPPDYFYTHVQTLANDGIISGYTSVPPCNNSLWVPCFKPYNTTTRGQMTKIISLAAGFNEPVTGQTFEDVPPSSTFYTYTERLAVRDIIEGYPCGGVTEPCIPPEYRPYFRSTHKVTRGQLSKMTSGSFGWSEPVTGQQFEDVEPGSIYYDYIGRLYGRGLINGYPCGSSPNRPCVPPDNRPYFEPFNNVTRGQTAKIVQLARMQPTATYTPTPLSTSTPTSLPAASTSTPTTTPDLTTTPTATTLTTR
jgi:hypothetical protein